MFRNLWFDGPYGQCELPPAKANGWFPRKGSSAVRIVRPQLNQHEQLNEQGEVV
jgi:hypothetical protein